MKPILILLVFFLSSCSKPTPKMELKINDMQLNNFCLGMARSCQDDAPSGISLGKQGSCGHVVTRCMDELPTVFCLQDSNKHPGKYCYRHPDGTLVTDEETQ
jgi:hypothetical protein